MPFKVPPANRVAVYLTSVAGLLAALAPAVANLDVSSTVGVLGGVGAIVLVVRKWLEGWQAHEARQAAQPPAPPVVSSGTAAHNISNVEWREVAKHVAARGLTESHADFQARQQPPLPTNEGDLEHSVVDFGKPDDPASLDGDRGDARSASARGLKEPVK